MQLHFFVDHIQIGKVTLLHCIGQRRGVRSLTFNHRAIISVQVTILITNQSKFRYPSLNIKKSLKSGAKSEELHKIFLLLQSTQLFMPAESPVNCDLFNIWVIFQWPGGGGQKSMNLGLVGMDPRISLFLPCPCFVQTHASVGRNVNPNKPQPSS